MTTGRINQVATVGLRPHAGRGASNDQRSPHRAELASHSHDDTTVFFHRSLTEAPGRPARRPKPPRTWTRTPASLAFAAPVAGPEYSRRSGSYRTYTCGTPFGSRPQDNRWKSTEETLAGPQARWPRSQPGVFKIASYQSDSVRPSKANRVRDRSTTYQRRPFCRLPCPVCTLHCRFTYIAKHRVAAFSQPEFTYRYICIPYDLA